MSSRLSNHAHTAAAAAAASIYSRHARTGEGSCPCSVPSAPTTTQLWLRLTGVVGRMVMVVMMGCGCVGLLACLLAVLVGVSYCVGTAARAGARTRGALLGLPLWVGGCVVVVVVVGCEWPLACMEKRRRASWDAEIDVSVFCGGSGPSRRSPPLAPDQPEPRRVRSMLPPTQWAWRMRRLPPPARARTTDWESAH